MKDRSKIEEFLKDLSLTVPYLQSYEMVDWLLLALYFLGLIKIIRNRLQGLFLLSIVDLGYCAYNVYFSEYAQAILFLVYGVLTAWGCFDQYTEKKRLPKSLF